MIVYFDTSAFVPLLVEERTSGSCLRIWGDADAVLSTRLLYVESVSALKRAVEHERASDSLARSAVRRLDELWAQVKVIEIDSALTDVAANVAWRFGLRGFDAVHCAAAATLRDSRDLGGSTSSPLVAASGDRRLLAAWRDLGIATFEPTP